MTTLEEEVANLEEEMGHLQVTLDEVLAKHDALTRSVMRLEFENQALRSERDSLRILTQKLLEALDDHGVKVEK